MSDTPAAQVEAAAHPRSRRRWRRLAVVFAIMLLLFGVPWWTLLSAGTQWPPIVVILGTVGLRRRIRRAAHDDGVWTWPQASGPGRGDR